MNGGFTAAWNTNSKLVWVKEISQVLLLLLLLCVASSLAAGCFHSAADCQPVCEFTEIHDDFRIHGLA